MKTLYFVSCVSRKKEKPTAAKDLYVSDWFLKARAYVESLRGEWFILSAEHGLVSPEVVIAPYDKTLNTMPIAERRMWAARVLAQLERELGGVERVVMLAGARYREFLVDALRGKGLIVEIPLEGMAIGKQLRWLKHHLGDK